MIGRASVAAAAATVGTDLFANKTWSNASKGRVIRGIAVVGSVAINDTEVELLVEDRSLGHFTNNKAGVVAAIAEDIKGLGAKYVPIGSKISCIVRTAPTTNPIIVELF